MKTSKKSIQVALFKKVAQFNAQKGRLVDIIMEVLNLTKSQSYRRINGNVPLTLEELGILRTHFGISIDEILPNSDKANEFNFKSSFEVNKKPEDFVRFLSKSAQYAATQKKVCLDLATNEFPIFYSFIFPELAAFKFYMWKTTFWTNQGNKGHFSFDLAKSQAVKDATAALSAYIQIPTRELWNKRLSDNTIMQINFARDAGWFKRDNDAEVLVEQVRSVYSHIKKMAEVGKKFLPHQEISPSLATWELYITELPTNIHYLLRSAENLRLFTTFNKPNFLEIKDPKVCDYISDWFLNLREKSTCISNTGFKDRNHFFKGLLEKVKLSE